MPITPRVLAIGSHDSGKTTYRTQLVARLDFADGRLKLARAMEDGTNVAADLHRLNAGLQPQHTSASVYHSTQIQVLRDGAEFTLDFPDYGGEQLNQMFKSNVVPLDWVARLKQAEGWILFLRIDRFRPRPNAFIAPTATSVDDGQTASSESTLDGSLELEAVELLQRFLFVADVSLRRPTASPRLAVLLSCWDELPATTDTPEQTLMERAPLLNAFIESNWRPEHRRIWALSSTERPLPKKAPDTEFAAKGPESFGYVISGATQRNRDLTAPVAWLLGDE